MQPLDICNLSLIDAFCWTKKLIFLSFNLSSSVNFASDYEKASVPILSAVIGPFAMVPASPLDLARVAIAISKYQVNISSSVSQRAATQERKLCCCFHLPWLKTSFQMHFAKICPVRLLELFAPLWNSNREQVDRASWQAQPSTTLFKLHYICLWKRRIWTLFKVGKKKVAQLSCMLKDFTLQMLGLISKKMCCHGFLHSQALFSECEEMHKSVLHC